MIKKIFVFLILTLFTTNSFSAGSDSTSTKVKSNYDKAVQSISLQKNMKQRGSLRKQKKDMQKLKNYF